MTSLKTISPAEAAARMKTGAVLVDIREPDEYARERIDGALSRPLSRFERARFHAPNGVIFHCKSGGRTHANAAQLAAAADCEAFVLEGGIDRWRAAGLPVTKDDKQPIEIMRQVQIAAGSLVLIGVILGLSVSPAFYGLSAFVGAGLVFAGVSGSCIMAKALAVMPWNRAARA